MKYIIAFFLLFSSIAFGQKKDVVIYESGFATGKVHKHMHENASLEVQIAKDSVVTCRILQHANDKSVEMYSGKLISEKDSSNQKFVLVDLGEPVQLELTFTFKKPKSKKIIELMFLILHEGEFGARQRARGRVELVRK